MDTDSFENEHKMNVSDFNFYTQVFTQFNLKYILLDLTYMNIILLLIEIKICGYITLTRIAYQ